MSKQTKAKAKINRFGKKLDIVLFSFIPRFRFHLYATLFVFSSHSSHSSSQKLLNSPLRKRLSAFQTIKMQYISICVSLSPLLFTAFPFFPLLTFFLLLLSPSPAPNPPYTTNPSPAFQSRFESPGMLFISSSSSL